MGVTTVTWTATDANGNSATATQLVTVNLIDTVAPVITVPANVYTSTSTSQATVSIGTATATDNVDGIVAVTNDAPATYPIGVTTVTWTASDAAGNTATATQNVYVSYSSTVGGGSGGTTTPSPAGGGATVTSEAVYWHHNDHLGTPQALTDINGTKVWEMSQTPFGIATVNEDPDGDGLTVTNNFRFPGQYFDAETGLNHNGFRTYDPGTGYTQSDPIGLNGGMNTFTYVGGNPISFIDPSGLKPGDNFKSPEAAAVDAIEYIWATKADWKKREYGGWIYPTKCGGYTYKEPIPGSSDKIQGFPVYKPKSAENAWYHTHPEPTIWDALFGITGEDFSYPNDISISNANNSDGFLGTPSGGIIRYTPVPKGTGYMNGVSRVK